MLNIWQNRRKLPWQEHLFAVVALYVAIQIIHWVSGADLLLSLPACLAGGFAAGYSARYLAIWAGGRFPALKSEHAGYFDLPTARRGPKK